MNLTLKLRWSLLLTGLFLVPAQAAEVGEGTLYWGNGDSLKGRLISAEGNVLKWAAPELFADPLEIDLSVLSAVRFQQADEDAANDPKEFRITTSDGNVLYGQITAVDAETISFKSKRHGQMTLKKNGVLNLRRSATDELLFQGPNGLDGWAARGTGAKLSDWKELNDGSLQTLKGDTGIYRRMKFPDRCAVEVVLESSRIPDFVLAMGGRVDENPRLEVWGEILICRCGLDFVELQELKEKKVHLHIFTDFKEEVMAVYSSSGKLLGRTDAKGWKPPTSGIIFESVDGDLAIKQLRISSWDGRLPKVLKPGENRVQTTTGSVHYGEVRDFDADGGNLVVAATNEETGEAKNESIPIGTLTHVVLSTEENGTNDEGRTLVSWKDGGYLTGDMVALTHESVSLKVSYSDEPVKCSLSGVRRIRLPNSAKTQIQPDRLFFSGGSLHGNLTVEDHDSAPIRWKPVGGLNATTLVSRGKARFQRGAEPEQLSIDTETYPDVVFLNDGDVLPCAIERCTKEAIQLRTPVSAVRQIACNQIKAVELGSITRMRQIGFEDADWKRTVGSATRTAEKLAFRGNCTIGNPEVLTGNSVSFKMRWTPQTYGTVTTWLYAEKMKEPEQATPIVFQLGAKQLTITNRPPDQNQRVFFGARGEVQKKDGIAKLQERDADIKMVTRDGKVTVFVNGMEIKSFELNEKGTGSRGFIFDAKISLMSTRSSGFEGRVTDGNARMSPLEITRFGVRSISGTSAAQFINAEARSRTLTIPRFRRDDPPTHVLLAPNGDLLRGRLEEITDESVVFESRLETFRFPRARISAVVWLQEEEATPVSRAETAVQAQLDNGYTLTMTPERMKDGQLMGHSDLLGECRIPAKSIRDLFLGSPDGRQEILSYVSWITSSAPEPQWEKQPDDSGQSSHEHMIGTVADDFELKTFDGGTFRLSDHKEKIVVLDFWASWCGPCVRALPQYVNATAKFDKEEAIFVAVNLEESRERIQEFLTTHNMSPKVAMDRGSVIARRFEVEGIPHSVILGKGNVIQHVTVGAQEGLQAATEKKIADLLKATPAN